MPDYDEKLETAREYLLEYPAGSQEFEAAAEHLLWAIDNGNLADLSKIERIGAEIIARRGNDKRALKRLTELLAP